ncbi:hypothetical protein AK812_SmicGene31750 [Symbiodinium microadriaticum]|uniref:Uncharacterized protein n=1 Tax=Symbiodinium microadriaticum TaxID=2951 RepID=A0A1Q9CVV2_SYMMI|nr:hypothetical protein AK812_SmicGene31750 [Symbiodinium microadriaticum]
MFQKLCWSAFKILGVVQIGHSSFALVNLMVLDEHIIFGRCPLHVKLTRGSSPAHRRPGGARQPTALGQHPNVVSLFSGDGHCEELQGHAMPSDRTMMEVLEKTFVPRTDDSRCRACFEAWTKIRRPPGLVYWQARPLRLTFVAGPGRKQQVSFENTSWSTVARDCGVSRRADNNRACAAKQCSIDDLFFRRPSR